MTALIAEPMSEPSVIGMWGLVLVLVIAALAWSIALMLRARRKSRERPLYEPGLGKVAASAGTHTGAGAADLRDMQRTVDNLVARRLWFDSAPPPPTLSREFGLAEETIALTAVPDVTNGVLHWDVEVNEVDMRRIVGFDREGTPVMVADLVDGNIDFKDVLRHGDVYADLRPRHVHGVLR